MSLKRYAAVVLTLKISFAKLTNCQAIAHNQLYQATEFLLFNRRLQLMRIKECQILQAAPP